MNGTTLGHPEGRKEVPCGTNKRKMKEKKKGPRNRKGRDDGFSTTVGWKIAQN